MTKGASWVNIIESLAQRDLSIGRSEGELLQAGLKLIGIPYKYTLVRTRGEFLDALGRVTVQGTQEFKRIPWFHFSMHGCREGIELTNSEFLPWKDLNWKLRMINGKMDHLVVVSMSSCSGLSGYRMLQEEVIGDSLQETPPFGLLIGNVVDVPWSDAGIGYLTLYHLLSKGVGFHDAVVGMRVASGNEGFFGTLPDPTGQAKSGLIIGLSDEEAERLRLAWTNT